MRNDSDSAWKDILDVYFKEFIDYCLPSISTLINWQKPYVLLDKELQMITRGTKTGKQLVDKLFKVHLKNGQEQWILVHLEVQQKKEIDFAKRMFIYGYRIYDKYQQAILSCAILIDTDKHWRPNNFKIGFADSYLCSQVVMIKMIDYQNQLNELEMSSNVFACVIYNQLCAIELLRKSHEERKQGKFALTKRLYKKGYSKNEISNLYKFIDFVIGLPKPLELEYINEVNQLEEMIKMAYVTSMERYGKIIFRKQGIEEGRVEGRVEGRIEGRMEGKQEEKLEIAKRMIEEGYEITEITKITRLSINEVKELVPFQSIETPS